MPLIRPNGVNQLSEKLTADGDKGELSILGRRRAVVDLKALLEYLDILVGSQVAEVIVRSLETRLGRNDANRIRQENPGVNIQEIIRKLIAADGHAGFGLTSVSLPEDGSQRIRIEVTNPYLRGRVVAVRLFHFARWAGILGALLNNEFEIESVYYDEGKNTAQCELLPRRK
jgi:hypothetical protein